MMFLLRPHRFTVPPPPVVYPLDALGLAPIRAFSTRKLRAAYAGNCYVVERASDGATQGIGFTAAGWVDRAAELAFLGGSDGRLVTWLDQSGNTRNTTQTTTNNRPLSVLGGVSQVDAQGRPSLLWRRGGYVRCFPYTAPFFHAGGTVVGQVHENSTNTAAILAERMPAGVINALGVHAGGAEVFFSHYNGGAWKLAGAATDLFGAVHQLAGSVAGVSPNATLKLFVDAVEQDSQSGVNTDASPVEGLIGASFNWSTPDASWDGWMREWMQFAQPLTPAQLALLQ